MKISDLGFILKENISMQDPGEYDQEGDMAQRQLLTAKDAADELRSILTADENLPEWVQKKISLAVDYLNTARDYMKSTKTQNMDESLESLKKKKADIEDKMDRIVKRGGKVLRSDPLYQQYNKVITDIKKAKNASVNEEKQKGVDGKACWKGYKRMGTKMKGGKRVDNCVPIKGKK